MTRDLHGYGRQPPAAHWPGEARVAVSFVVNFEEGAEYAIGDGDSRNESVYEVQDEVIRWPDPCAVTHYDHGTRVGWWRIAKLFERFRVPMTLSSCGRAVARAPWLARDAMERGHEVSAHGWRWESHAGMDESVEREAIARTAATIAAATGTAPTGWHTRSASSPNTRRLLVEHGGFLYDSDDYSDELPFFTPVGQGQHLVIPYAFDTNDMHFHQGHQRFVHGDDFARYVMDAFEWLWREGEDCPRLLSVGLHLRMIGRAGRIAALESLLDRMTRRGQVWFARRHDIATHWLDRFGDRLSEGRA